MISLLSALAALLLAPRLALSLTCPDYCSRYTSNVARCALINNVPSLPATASAGLVDCMCSPVAHRDMQECSTCGLLAGHQLCDHEATDDVDHISEQRIWLYTCNTYLTHGLSRAIACYDSGIDPRVCAMHRETRPDRGAMILQRAAASPTGGGGGGGLPTLTVGGGGGGGGMGTSNPAVPGATAAPVWMGVGVGVAAVLGGMGAAVV